MTRLNKDVAAGLIFVAIGGFFALDAAFNLRIGRALSMGPGYFPLILGTLLARWASRIAASAASRQAASRSAPVPWRGLVLVLGAIVVFAATRARRSAWRRRWRCRSLMAARASGKLGWTARWCWRWR